MSGARTIWPLLSALLAGPVAAAEVPLESGGYLELGMSFHADRSLRAQADREGRRPSDTGIDFNVSGAWRWGRVFVEGRRGGLDGAGLGATVWHDERRALELLLAHVPGSVQFRYSTDEEDPAAVSDEMARSAALLDRNSAFGTSGLRYREYRGDTLLQASAVADWNNGNGVVLGAHAGRQWQLGNWSLQGVVGLRWVQAELVDFLYGVDPDEATTRFAAYEGEDTLFGEADVGVTRALGRDWVLFSSLRARRFGSGITDSPLVASDTSSSAELGVAYVF